MSETKKSTRQSGYMTLNEGDSSYHFLFDENPSLSLIIDYARGIQDVNKKACEILGFKKIDIIGKDPLDIIHPTDRIKITNLIDQLFNKEKVSDIEADIVTSSGEIKKILFAPGKLVEYNREFCVLISGTDITETKKTLREFEQNHELFTRFMNLIPAGIFLRDEQNSYIFRNKFINENFDPETVNRLGVNEVSGFSLSRFLGIKDKKGKERYCEITTFRLGTKPFENYTGGIIADLTEGIESERLKRESEILFKKIFENSGVGIILTNVDGNIIEANPSFSKTCGYSDKELKNKNLRDFLHPDDALDIPISGLIGVYQAQKRIITKTKSIVWSNYSSTIIPYDSGEPQYIIHMIENITEKKVISEVLENYEHRNKAIISVLPDLIFIIDRNGKYIDYSAGSSKDLAAGEGEIIGLNIRDIFPPDTTAEIMQKIAECIETGEPVSIEYSLDIAGEKKFFEARLVKYSDTSIFSVVRNITDVKVKEIQLKKYADELAGLNTSKDRLFSIIAHDLRSPFHALLGLSELLATDIDELTNEDIRKIAKELHVAFKNEYSLLENLLSWSIVQKEKIVITEEEVNLHLAVQEISQLLGWLAGKKKISIVNKVPAECKAKTDFNLLHSILQNLLSNALKFSDEDSTVEVEYKEVEGKPALEISDHGVGMSDEEIELILHNTSYTKPGTAQEKGTGLGLIICRDFIERLGGKLYLTSKKGKGTTATFTFKKD